MLHIANGETVTGTFRQVRFPGTYIAWNDPLHDGPVPHTQTLSELSDVRAEALAGFGWGNHEKLRADFANRDRTLQDFRKHQDVVLWFEHDLYDQLQLLQLLDWFEQQDIEGINLDLVQIDSYPGVRPFYGLGQLSGTQLARLFPMRKRVTHTQRSIATETWRAFRAEDPTDLLAISQQKLDEMPFLAAALVRFFEEYPSTTDGLSRTERQVLQAAATGKRKKQEIYMESRKQEDVPWGDASVYLRLAWLAAGPNPALIEAPKNEFTVTDAGRQLLEGKADWIKLQGKVDRWLGGVHLTGQQPQWRWHNENKMLITV
jgi:preprotein translocase subunit Sec61beta